MVYQYDKLSMVSVWADAQVAVLYDLVKSCFDHHVLQCTASTNRGAIILVELEMI
jgi:hypothetical protein